MSNTTELAHIAGSAANVYSAANFNDLISSNFVEDIKKGSCAEGMIMLCC